MTQSHQFDQNQSQSFIRGQIWMVDFGQPVGTEAGMEHPAVIVSSQSLTNAATYLNRLIVVPGTSTQILVRGKTISMHEEVFATATNGLAGTTYFTAEQVRASSTKRFRRVMGMLEGRHLKNIEDKLCEVMSLFR